MFDTRNKIGILGGGQLGKMLCLAAADWDWDISVLDASADYPAGPYCTRFTEGNFKDYDDVLAFGADKDVLTIEIEHVNTDALKELAASGKAIHPSPEALEIIKDKGLQKNFYKDQGIPTAEFQLFANEKALKKAVTDGKLIFPFVQKTRTAGYDGQGVAVIRAAKDLNSKLLKGASMVEALVPIQTELAVVAARNPSGEVVVFPPVEMEFHPEANLVEYLICPARVSPLVAAEAEALAERVIRAFDISGLLAVEMFLTRSGELLVNEVAPRPHNSGHHTIESADTSQFQQHLRAICDLPLGKTAQQIPAVMVNVLGHPDHKGPVQYVGVEDCMEMEGVHLHLYGKALTSPFRKMGHVTITDADLDKALEKAKRVKNVLQVIARKQ